MLSISVIIPCFRDERFLRALFDQLHQGLQRDDEILVVDGADSVSCREICQRYQVHQLAGEACRGRQLLSGAMAAKGDILWFLHADSRISCNALQVIRDITRLGALGGYFRFRFDLPRAWPAFLLEPAIALRCRFGVPYGDQGIFVLRNVYRQVGGHAPWPLFEEAPLVKKLRQLGQFAALREPIFVNSRRWQQEGWWRRTWRNRKLALRYAGGASPEDLAKRYYIKT